MPFITCFPKWNMKGEILKNALVAFLHTISPQGMAGDFPPVSKSRHKLVPDKNAMVELF